MQLHWVYAFASILLPIVGMVLSMLSHRYAYMNLAATLAVIFAYMAFRLYVNKNVDKHVDDTVDNTVYDDDNVGNRR